MEFEPIRDRTQDAEENESPFSVASELDEVPEYHDDLLLVQAQPDPDALAALVEEGGIDVAALTAGGEDAALKPFPGLRVLADLERQGIVSEVRPLSVNAVPITELPGAFTLLSHGAAMMAEIRATTAGGAPSDFAAPDPNANFALVRVANEDARHKAHQILEGTPGIGVERVPVRYLAATSSHAVADLWNLQTIQWQQACALPNFDNAAKIRVAVLDTGVDTTHPDIAGRITHYAFDHPLFPGTVSDKDIVGHGTHVVGTIGATLNAAKGVTGICGCDLWVWKIFSDDPVEIPPSGTYKYLVEPQMYRTALAQLVYMNPNNRPHVVNLSIGGKAPLDSNEQQTFDALLAQGTVIVAAMGNQRYLGSPKSYPAAHPGIIAVGATDQNDVVANFSNAGAHITLCAPGVGILSTLPTYAGQTGFDGVRNPDGTLSLGAPRSRATNYAEWDGTSMAAPHVTAAVALLLARRGATTPAAVRDRLMETAHKVAGMTGSNFNNDYGAGRLDLLNLLRP